MPVPVRQGFGNYLVLDEDNSSASGALNIHIGVKRVDR